jgi:hypothetical protein
MPLLLTYPASINLNSRTTNRQLVGVSSRRNKTY